MTALYTLSDVTLTVPGRTLLHGLDLSLPSGKVTGLIGHNGSGKSTLRKLLSRQMQPTQGSIAFAGRPLPGWSTRALARHLAYLPQHPPAAEGLSVRELAALGRYPWHGALGRPGPEDRNATDFKKRKSTGCGLITNSADKVGEVGKRMSLLTQKEDKA